MTDYPECLIGMEVEAARLVAARRGDVAAFYGPSADPEDDEYCRNEYEWILLRHNENNIVTEIIEEE